MTITLGERTFFLAFDVAVSNIKTLLFRIPGEKDGREMKNVAIRPSQFFWMAFASKMTSSSVAGGSSSVIGVTRHKISKIFIGSYIFGPLNPLHFGLL